MKNEENSIEEVKQYSMQRNYIFLFEKKTKKKLSSSPLVSAPHKQIFYRTPSLCHSPLFGLSHIKWFSGLTTFPCLQSWYSHP